MRRVSILLASRKGQQMVPWFSCLLALAIPALSQAAGPYEVDWYTIDSGGGTISGGPYVVTSTIGQPDADWMSGGIYEVLGGFWPGAPIKPHCVYDLEEDGFIGPGDFSLFACCWLRPAGVSGCGGAVACIMCDFDCDGTVAPGDLAFFATAWAKICDDPSIQWPPCQLGAAAYSSLGAMASSYSVPDVKVCAVTLASPSASDTTETLPTSVSSLTAGQDYYVEVWAGDVGSTNTGLTSVYVDLDFNPCGAVSVQSIAHGGIFTVFESGTIEACSIHELGGSSLSAVAKEPQWARVAVVEIHAEASGPVSCSLRPNTTGIAAFGRGLIPPSLIEFGPRSAGGCLPSTYSTYNDWVTLGKPDCWCAPYQCDGDADAATEGFQKYRVMSNDLGILAANWKKLIDDATLDPCADIDHKPQGSQDYRVMSNDLAIVIANWKKQDCDLAGNCPRPE